MRFHHDVMHASCVGDSGRKENAFWITTGCYPQELVLQLGGAASVSVIKTVTVNGKHLS